MCNKQKGKPNDDDIRKVIKLYQKIAILLHTISIHINISLRDLLNNLTEKSLPNLALLWNTFTLFLRVSNIILTHPEYKPKILCCISLGISQSFAILLTIRGLPTLRNEIFSIMYSCKDVCTQLLLSRYSILPSVNTHLY